MLCAPQPLLLAGQVEPHTRVTLADWLFQSHHHGIAAAAGRSVAFDFSLENLHGLAHLLQNCSGLTSLEATGNSITSLAGLLLLVCSIVSKDAAVSLTAVCVIRCIPVTWAAAYRSVWLLW